MEIDEFSYKDEETGKIWIRHEETDKTWWLYNPDHFGEIVFSFDKKKQFYIYGDYPKKLTKKQKEIFDKENPFWVDFFADEESKSEIGEKESDQKEESMTQSKSCDTQQADEDEHHVKWDYFDKYNYLLDKYMPKAGEGKTMSSQIVTAVNKLVYKYYADGDVYDNRYGLSGWCNDLSSYANWLAKYTPAKSLLEGITNISSEDDYEELLASLADMLLDEEFLKEHEKRRKKGSLYDCDGPFEFIELEEYEEEDDEEDDEW